MLLLTLLHADITEDIIALLGVSGSQRQVGVMPGTVSCTMYSFPFILITGEHS